MGIIFPCANERSSARKQNVSAVDRVAKPLEREINPDEMMMPPSEFCIFNWSSMQHMLLGYNTSFYGKKITRQDIIAADKMLLYIDQDLGYHCTTLLDRLLSTRHNFIEEFQYHTNCARIVPQNEDDTSSRALLHNFHMIYMHKKILNALQFEGNPFEILDLLALSHAVMKVTTADFKLMNIVLCKYLSSLELEVDVDVRPFVQYLNVITNYVCNSMEKLMKNDNMIDEITSKTTLNVTAARRNYRQLKKWQEVIDSIRKECTVLHKATVVDIPTARKPTKEELIDAFLY